MFGLFGGAASGGGGPPKSSEEIAKDALISAQGVVATLEKVYTTAYNEPEPNEEHLAQGKETVKAYIHKMFVVFVCTITLTFPK